MLQDFRQDPIRMIELNLRKLSMFWNNHEYVSNVNYEQQGISKSRLIATLSANGWIGMASLSFFVWIGMIQLITERKRENWFIVTGIAMLIFGTTLFVLAGRLRVPVMPFLMVATAVGLSSIWDAISTRKLSRRLIVALTIAIALSFIFPSWMPISRVKAMYLYRRQPSSVMMSLIMRFALPDSTRHRPTIRKMVISIFRSIGKLRISHLTIIAWSSN